jgi:hypothetical protein
MLQHRPQTRPHLLRPGPQRLAYPLPVVLDVAVQPQILGVQFGTLLYFALVVPAALLEPLLQVDDPAVTFGQGGGPLSLPGQVLFLLEGHTLG